MRIGAFEIAEPLPECHEPYVFATLHPWIDVNNVGSMVLSEVESQFEATELGRLAVPGNFYDFTRYRPTIHIEQGIQSVTVPNTIVNFARREGENDILTLRLLEPHNHVEHFIASVLKLLKTLNVRKYILLGSMYDTVPHTRPLLVSGYGMGKEALEDARKAGLLPINYRGPTSMANLITKKAAEVGIATCSFIVSLPQYVVLEEDYLGKVRLMELLSLLYNVPVDREDFDRALKQRNIISRRVESSPEAKALLPQLETVYDMRVKSVEKDEGAFPDIEEMFWTAMGKDIGKA